MLKKLLILPILGSILGLGAFASADSITFTSNGNGYSPSSFQVVQAIANYDISTDSYVCANDDCSIVFVLDNVDKYSCFTEEGVTCGGDFDNLVVGNYSVVVGNIDDYYNKSFSSITLLFPDNSVLVPEIPEIPDDFDSSLGIPEIPNSFTSGLTSLVNNFGGTIVNWLPTIILVALGIYAIFALFRVVRNYARSSFRG